MQRVESDLPPPEEREALLGVLATLCARGGPAALLDPPLEPTRRWFPDRWDEGGDGAARLAARLLRYAGLPRLVPELEVDRDGLGPVGTAPGTSAAWFMGIDGDRARFGIVGDLLSDPEGAAAALAHEVAHAWRTYHRLVEAPAAREEMLTDATTVYLGFGILTTNAASRHRSSGELRGAYAVHRWSHQTLGYLSPAAMAFLLAAQAIGQGAGWRRRRAIAARLEPNQAAAFKAACRLLRREAAGLRQRLGVPGDVVPRDRAEPSAGDALEFETVPGEDEADEVDVAPRRANGGRATFRVRRRQIGRAIPAGLFMGALAFGVGLLASGMALRDLAPDAGFSIGLVVASVAGGLTAVAWGGHVGRVRSWCSEPDCCALLATGDTVCPRCGGTISGTIRHWDERLEAEERLHAAREAEPECEARAPARGGMAPVRRAGSGS